MDAATKFALPVGTRVKLTLQNDRVWEGTIEKISAMGCDLIGKRNARRPVVRNVNSGVGFFIEMSGWKGRDFAVMSVETI
jgi:hypothetical protein